MLNMRCCSFLVLSSTLFLATLIAGEGAAQARCPWNDYGQSWYLHFNDRSGPRGTALPRGAVVLFEKNAKIPDDELWEGMCPTISVLADWQTNGTLSYGVRGHLNNSIYPYAIDYSEQFGVTIRLYNRNEARWDIITSITQIRPRLDKFKFSILDDEFTFNEAGEVYHKVYGKVGKFLCTLPPATHPCRAGKFTF